MIAELIFLTSAAAFAVLFAKIAADVYLHSQQIEQLYNSILRIEDFLEKKKEYDELELLIKLYDEIDKKFNFPEEE